jgi:hypothetical protein
MLHRRVLTSFVSTILRELINLRWIVPPSLHHWSCIAGLMLRTFLDLRIGRPAHCSRGKRSISVVSGHKSAFTADRGQRGSRRFGILSMYFPINRIGRST